MHKLYVCSRFHTKLQRVIPLNLQTSIRRVNFCPFGNHSERFNDTLISIGAESQQEYGSKSPFSPSPLLKLQADIFQVVLAASICTRGGKAVLSRQFREISRSRIEGLLASFPKLADSSTQHTTVEQDNVRYVYQPLDELYMVLITNRQSNILQDIDSLHLFAQVVTSICKSLDEREILRNAYEVLSAFDEVVTLGYRENLSLSQIKTFLEMESHEERIQEIISRVRVFPPVLANLC